MRWIKKPEPRDGAVRIKTWFALLPVSIYDETRWLERVSVRQVYSESYSESYFSGWRNREFVIETKDEGVSK